MLFNGMLNRNRIETYNAGAAPKTVEEIISNEATAPRNPLIAKLFRMAGFAETAGSGMLKIFSAWKQLNYKMPVIDNNVANYYFKMTFPMVEKTFRVKAGYKMPVTKVGEKVGEKLTANQRKIIQSLKASPDITANELAKIVGISQRKIEENLSKLKKINVIERVGADRGGCWKILI